MAQTCVWGSIRQHSRTFHLGSLAVFGGHSLAFQEMLCSSCVACADEGLRFSSNPVPQLSVVGSPFVVRGGQSDSRSHQCRFSRRFLEFLTNVNISALSHHRSPQLPRPSRLLTAMIQYCDGCMCIQPTRHSSHSFAAPGIHNVALYPLPSGASWHHLERVNSISSPIPPHSSSKPLVRYRDFPFSRKTNHPERPCCATPSPRSRR